MLPSQSQVPEIGSKFQTVESFKEAAQQGAKAAGFAFSVSSSKMSHNKKGGQASYIILQYTMEGEYRNNHNIIEETRKRIKFTKHQGCPVALYAVLDEKASVWILNTEQKELVHMMLKSEVPIQSVADAVQWKHGTVYTKDIVNEHDRIRNALNEGSNNDTTMRLLQILEECQYVVRHLLSKDDCMKNLFFTHIEAVRRAAICLEVLIINATYKTNLYKLSLINSVGVNNIGKAKSLDIYQITMAWFLNTLKETVYDTFFCSPEVFVSDKSQALRNAANKFFDSDNDYEKLLLSIQKVAYPKEMSIVEKAFEEVKQAAMKSRDPNYIQNYFEKWKKGSECWMHVYTKHYSYMGVQSMQQAERSHNSLKKAIEAASGLDQAINQIKKEICEAQENYDNTNNSVCNCSLRLNFKLPYHHIILSTGSIPLSIIHLRWLLKHNFVPLLPSSLSTDTAFNKALYMVEEKYANLNDSWSKALLLHKIEAFIAEEIVIPKTPAAKKKEKNTPKFTTDLPKSQQLLYHDQILTYMHEHIKKIINVNGDSNSNDDYETIMKEISWANGPCTFEHWMRMLQMGDVIANVYQRPLYFFSLQINFTFLPYHHPLNRNEALAIAFVNNNHYVAITLKPDAPVLSIVNRWTQFATSTAIRWKLLIQNHIDCFFIISSSSNEVDQKIIIIN
ncbi:7668_t:CDS:2 [Cetraspora pellucida]|uniref:7668_t:CDS:1 n=1 Tax=Cetraspora pellucida TaxID=1433469 RepID=A0A9N9EJT6_9GLOM|nr:7668_t:CDS:2 [Cetraspora pellucida]